MVPASTILNGINAAANVAGTVGSFMGGSSEGLSRDQQRFLADFNMKMENRKQDYAENQLTNTVRQAKEAGLHPLAALGIMPSGGGGSVPIPSGSSGPSMGERLQNMGQNVSRAIQAQQSLPSRALLQIQIDNEKAQGDFIRAQTAESLQRAKNLALPPAYPQSDNFGFSSTGSGDALRTGNKNVLIKNPDGSIQIEESPTYGSTLYHRPFSSAGRDLLGIIKEALGSTRNLYTNIIKHRPRATSWKSEI